MKVPIVSLLALWPLFSAALGPYPPLSGSETLTIEHCSTIRQPNSVRSVTTATHTTTITIPVHVTSSFTPTVTVTPSTVTATSTTSTTTTSTSVTTVATPTSTFTTTLTLLFSTTTTSTITAPTSTATEIQTSTSTTTTTLSSTVPTSAGFLPVISTLPGSAEKRKRAVNWKQTHSRRSSYTLPWQKPSTQCKAPTPDQPSSGGRPSRPVWDTCAQYAASVECQELVEIFSPIVTTVTAHTTVSATLTTATTTTTITSTSTATTTATITPPSANYTTTVTTSTTTLITAFSTTTPSTTTTSTSTVVTTATTSTVIYAACATPNIVGTLNGDGVYDVIYPGPSVGLATTDDSTAYDCCVSCINNPACAAAAFNANFGAGEQCFNFPADSCTVEGEYSFGAEPSSSVSPDTQYFISNGNCGAYNYVEAD
ncbi:hypothetical protein AYL99_11020 [Fonsecaea erecta]|uniref:Apple domain-containing protein n=1 Tax=Fonsecaea erecta TaxID=1367422 RepID=A0A178Z4B5_9EURO|nr:hypothetical protein AYL99_11020 [Fonsecaea erecta]OAP54572.1 hypothetical protein AYL99_11020 [Fonsecaea erecta]